MRSFNNLNNLSPIALQRLTFSTLLDGELVLQAAYKRRYSTMFFLSRVVGHVDTNYRALFDRNRRNKPCAD